MSVMTAPQYDFRPTTRQRPVPPRGVGRQDCPEEYDQAWVPGEVGVAPRPLPTPTTRPTNTITRWWHTRTNPDGAYTRYRAALGRSVNRGRKGEAAS